MLPGSRANRVWSAALSQAKNEGDRLVCANGYGLRLEHKAPRLDGMRCALVLFSNAVWKGFSGLQVSRAPDSTVMPSQGSRTRGPTVARQEWHCILMRNS